MNDLEILKDVYEKNMKIECFCELKVNPPISGQFAKRLLSGCYRALKVIEKYDTDSLEKDLRESIDEMENDLHSKNRIGIITYNLGARIQIHVAIKCLEEGDLFLKSRGKEK